MQDLQQYRNDKVQVDLGVLDFAKAFDMVPRKHLMTKHSYYGISGSLHNWIYQILANRSQTVVVEGAFSDEFYSIFINDLSQDVSCHVRLFADDCLIYRPIHSTQDQIALQHDLLALEAWRDTLGMRFNAMENH